MQSINFTDVKLGHASEACYNMLDRINDKFAFFSGMIIATKPELEFLDVIAAQAQFYHTEIDHSLVLATDEKEFLH